MVKKYSSPLHEVNNLLTSLNMAIEMILRQMSGPVTAQQKKHLRGMLSDVKKIAKLVKKVKESH